MSGPAAARGRPASSRVRARVEGVVQGVGFRPYVHRLAHEHALAGWVRNDRRGVVLEVEGDARELERFLARLAREAPPLAAIETVRAERLQPMGESRFRILASAGAGAGAALVAPDAAPCDECLTELFEPRDRRYRYPFINCTQCGPRYTIVRGVPYDRPLTTMAGFEMCANCSSEFEDPTGRRFHAQPNACPACGPTARLIDPSGASIPAAEPVAAAAAALLAGRIVAIKGAGGYQLACRAEDELAVAELRRRKRREEKPFALMARDLAAAARLVELSATERELLAGRERPIVLAPRRAHAGVAASVAPGSPDLGVMLPSTPLHHLLLADAAATLVMSSGNLGEEPIVYDDEDALQRLSSIADLLLVHDRPVHARIDDSVVRSLGPAAGRRALTVRRARGYVPASIELPLPARPLLACGAELKSTFCLARGSRAWVGPHVGDLRNWETLRAFREGVAHFEELFALTPEVFVHDLHPDYLSSAYAFERDPDRLMGVQHHHAHLAAVLAEHGMLEGAIGAIYDGAGLGSDGTVWGGELLAGGLREARRVGHLHPVRLPGGDAAAREPWRMACAWLLAAHDGDAPCPATIAAHVDTERWEQVAALARSGLASPLTTSAGRLFDAVAALCAIRTSSAEEGRAAAELEGVAEPAERGAYPLAVVESDILQLDPRETVRAILGELQTGVPVAIVSARFHNGLARATARALLLAAEREGVSTAVLSGGVFQNRLLLERCSEELARAGLRVLLPRQLPPNDGAVSYGQAAVAAARIASPSTASASASIAEETSGESPAPASKRAPSMP